MAVVAGRKTGSCGAGRAVESRGSVSRWDEGAGALWQPDTVGNDGACLFFVGCLSCFTLL